MKQGLLLGLVVIVLVLAVLVVFVQLGFLLVLQLVLLVVGVQLGVPEPVDLWCYGLFSLLMIVQESIWGYLKESEVGQVYISDLLVCWDLRVISLWDH